MCVMERTKLHRFMDAAGVSDKALSRESGVSLRHISYIKLGEVEPTRPKMAAILRGCQKLTGKKVVITDLFDFRAPRAAEQKKAVGF